ncbi:MAG: hypothetical protein ACD_79C01447G0002 [uncultured bacterium]|nr:MAG: hypothetical protein ACD_79C01447G0002 [uncultured bacterium]
MKTFNKFFLKILLTVFFFAVSVFSNEDEFVGQKGSLGNLIINNDHIKLILNVRINDFQTITGLSLKEIPSININNFIHENLDKIEKYFIKHIRFHIDNTEYNLKLSDYKFEFPYAAFTIESKLSSNLVKKEFKFTYDYESTYKQEDCLSLIIDDASKSKHIRQIAYLQGMKKILTLNFNDEKIQLMENESNFIYNIHFYITLFLISLIIVRYFYNPGIKIR